MESLAETSVYNVIILGNSKVGKTSIVCRYVNSAFPENPKTSEGVEYFIKTIPDPSLKVRLKILDTAGHERFKDILFNNYTRVHGALLVYDIHDRDSYDAAKEWAVKLKSRRGTCILGLVGHKVDVPGGRAVPTEEAERYCKENDILFSETSAKEDINIKKCFLDMAIVIRIKDVSAKLEKCIEDRHGRPLSQSKYGKNVPLRRMDSDQGSYSRLPVESWRNSH
ncbi:hypothetical protein KR074_008832 [Drosophila pseudoananassae]|nr:hypothetical protein KR074_008832 [Drosophila pseudoananassae]